MRGITGHRRRAIERCARTAVMALLLWTFGAVPAFAASQGTLGGQSSGSSQLTLTIVQPSPQPRFTATAAKTLGTPRFVGSGATFQLPPAGLVRAPSTAPSATVARTASNQLTLESVGELDGTSDLGDWVSKNLANAGEASLSVCLPTLDGNISLLDSSSGAFAFLGGGAPGSKTLAVSLDESGTELDETCSGDNRSRLSIYAVTATAAGPVQNPAGDSVDTVDSDTDASNQKGSRRTQSAEAASIQTSKEDYLLVRLVVTPK